MPLPPQRPNGLLSICGFEDWLAAVRSNPAPSQTLKGRELGKAEKKLHASMIEADRSGIAKIVHARWAVF